MQSILKELPDAPGVYQYFDKDGRLLYVGKAKSLKHRVKSYWRFTPTFRPNPDQSPRILLMLKEVANLDYIVVDSEADALILENALIKQLKPRYNILLRDDKTYPYIYIDESQPFPRFEITRKVVSGKQITYYGPFPNGARALFDALYETFPLVQKKNCLREGKACLFYQIDRCLAPCEGKIDTDTYAAVVEEAKEAIRKRTPLIEKMQTRMMLLATQERFEEAAILRDRIEAIKSLSLTSNIDLAKEIDADIFAIRNGETRGVVVRLFLRGGKIVSSSYNYFRHTHLYDTGEAYTQALLDFYGIDTPPPVSEILVAEDFEGMAEVAQALRLRFGKKVTLSRPKRGVKARLISLALKNCDELLKTSDTQHHIESEIAALCRLKRIPYRVETFDNSHMSGEATVGAMVVWDEGKWNKNAYRRYTLQSKDEYAQTEEMLRRRIADFDLSSPPDLWILDGGIAQLRLAASLLAQRGVDLDVIAIAKEKRDAKAQRAKGKAHDTLYIGDGEAIRLLPSDKRLQWIQRQRDEAHRFAVAYHRNRKRKYDMQSQLLEKKGIGPATVKKLLDYFGTFEAIYNADIEEIAAVTSKRVARLLSGDASETGQ